MAETFNEQLIQLGTTRVQWIALYYLGVYPGITQTELAERMNTKRSSTTRLMDRMEREGVIVRCKDQEDRRITRIYLSSLGKNNRDELLPQVEKICDQYVRGIYPEDMEIFIKVLQQMVDNAT